MKNCLILGSGRSGTSMMAGILYQAGYFLGDKLHKPMASNPKGFFEWMEINRINEEILEGYVKKTLAAKFFEWVTKKGTVYSPVGKNQKWLLSLPLNVNVESAAPSVAENIKKVLAREPFAYKDPRFSYTLPIWARYLKPDTVFICLFREPDITINSILKECSSRKYLGNLYITRHMAYHTWLNIYSHIVFKHAGNLGNFIFLHYNQVYDGTAIPILSNILGVSLQVNFVDPGLKRTVSSGSVPARVKELYQRLCAAANYQEK
jgi:hypothetical protein